MPKSQKPRNKTKPRDARQKQKQQAGTARAAEARRAGVVRSPYDPLLLGEVVGVSRFEGRLVVQTDTPLKVPGHGTAFCYAAVDMENPEVAEVVRGLKIGERVWFGGPIFAVNGTVGLHVHTVAVADGPNVPSDGVYALARDDDGRLLGLVLADPDTDCEIVPIPLEKPFTCTHPAHQTLH